MKLKRAPGPPTNNWIMGHLAELDSEHILDFYKKSREEYGEIVRFRVGTRILHLIAHPRFAQHVLLNNPKNYVKGSFYDKVRYMLGNGVLTAEGEEWRAQRRDLQKPFTPKNTKFFFPAMLEAVQILSERLENKRKAKTEVNIFHEMRRLTISIISRCLFGADVSSQTLKIGEHFDFLTKYTEENLMNPFSIPLWVPSPDNLAFRYHRAELYKIIDAFFEEKNQDKSHFALLSHLKEVNPTMTKADLRKQVMTLFLAGHETTSNQLTWMWAMLDKHPRVRLKLQKEVEEVLQGRSIKPGDEEKLTYCKMVILETLRLYPPAWAFPRNVVKKDNMCGYEIPAGSFVSTSIFLIQRHPEYFSDPETFFPERFLEKDLSRLRLQDGFFPFSYGPRKCLGDSFSMLESVIAVATLAQKFEFKLARGTKLEPIGLLTLQPKFPLIATVHKPGLADIDQTGERRQEV